MSIPSLNIADFCYDLPDERIAHHAVEPRDASQLLAYRAGQISHHSFTALPDLLPKGSFLVFNNTKVIPARLFFQKNTGAVIEIFLLQPERPSRILTEAMQQTNRCVWQCMIGNKKKWKNGEILTVIFEDITIEASLLDSSKNWVSFSWNKAIPFVEVIEIIGKIPLPPYISRQTNAKDSESYQTVYSKIEGAVAAPTAGLHFTETIFKELQKRGILHDFVTLHVGAGTFQPIKVEDISQHDMHTEQVVYDIRLVENLIQNIGHIIAVGTTSMRSLESLYWLGVQFLQNDFSLFLAKQFAYSQTSDLPTPQKALEAVLKYCNEQNCNRLTLETQIMIVPSYAFKICKGLITNYHQPNSTLILLIAAFVGADWKKIYNEALNNDYRFLSYGDSSLLLPSFSDDI